MESLETLLQTPNTVSLDLKLKTLLPQLRALHNEDIAEEISDECKIIKRFFNDGDIQVLFTIWRVQIENSNGNLETLICELVSLLLSLSRRLQFRSVGSLIARIVIREFMTILYRYLNSGKLVLIQSTLGLLQSVVMHSATCAREVAETFNFALKPLKGFLSIRKASSKSNPSGDIRTRYIHFLLAFFIRGDVGVKKTILETNNLIAPIFKDMKNDSYGLVKSVFEVLKDKIVDDIKLSRTPKVAFFNITNLKVLMELYGAEKIVSELLHAFLRHISLTPGVGICFPSQGWHTTKPNNPTLSKLLLLLNLQDLEQRDFFVDILTVCPDLVHVFWSSSAYLSFEPRSSLHYISNIALATRIILLPIPAYFGDVEAKGPPSVGVTMANLLPSVLGRVGVSKGLMSLERDVRYACGRMLEAVFWKLNEIIKLSSPFLDTSSHLNASSHLYTKSQLNVSSLYTKSHLNVSSHLYTKSHLNASISSNDSKRWEEYISSILQSVRVQVPDASIIISLQKSTQQAMEIDSVITREDLVLNQLRLMKKYVEWDLMECRYDFGKVLGDGLVSEEVVEAACCVLEAVDFKWWIHLDLILSLYKKFDRVLGLLLVIFRKTSAFKTENNCKLFFESFKRFEGVLALVKEGLMDLHQRVFGQSDLVEGFQTILGHETVCSPLLLYLMSSASSPASVDFVTSCVINECVQSGELRGVLEYRKYIIDDVKFTGLIEWFNTMNNQQSHMNMNTNMNLDMDMDMSVNQILFYIQAGHFDYFNLLTEEKDYLYILSHQYILNSFLPTLPLYPNHSVQILAFLPYLRQQNVLVKYKEKLIVYLNHTHQIDSTCLTASILLIPTFSHLDQLALISLVSKYPSMQALLQYLSVDAILESKNVDVMVTWLSSNTVGLERVRKVLGYKDVKRVGGLLFSEALHVSILYSILYTLKPSKSKDFLKTIEHFIQPNGTFIVGLPKTLQTLLKQKVLIEGARSINTVLRGLNGVDEGVSKADWCIVMFIEKYADRSMSDLVREVKVVDGSVSVALKTIALWDARNEDDLSIELEDLRLVLITQYFHMCKRETGADDALVCEMLGGRVFKVRKATLEAFVKMALKYRIADKATLDYLASVKVDGKKVLEMVVSHSSYLDILKKSDVVKEALLGLILSLLKQDPIKHCTPSLLLPLVSSYNGTKSKPDLLTLSIIALFESSANISVAPYTSVWGGQEISNNFHFNRAEVLSAVDSLYMANTIHLLPSSLVYSKRWSPVYDPDFFLPLVLSVLMSEGTIDVHRLLESNVVGMVVVMLSSSDVQVRKSCNHILALFFSAMDASDLKERNQVLLVLDTLRNAIDSNIYPIIPSIITSFVAQSLMILIKPESDLYPLINRFCLQRPVMDLHDIPLLYEFLYSAKDDCRKERLWVLRLLMNGLKSAVDYQMFRRRHVISLLFSLFTSPVSDLTTRKLIFEIIMKAAVIPTAISHMVTKCGLLPFLKTCVTLLVDEEGELRLAVPLLLQTCLKGFMAADQGWDGKLQRSEWIRQVAHIALLLDLTVQTHPSAWYYTLMQRTLALLAHVAHALKCVDVKFDISQSQLHCLEKAVMMFEESTSCVRDDYDIDLLFKVDEEAKGKKEAVVCDLVKVVTSTLEWDSMQMVVRLSKGAGKGVLPWILALQLNEPSKALDQSVIHYILNCIDSKDILTKQYARACGVLILKGKEKSRLEMAEHMEVEDGLVMQMVKKCLVHTPTPHYLLSNGKLVQESFHSSVLGQLLVALIDPKEGDGEIWLELSDFVI